MAQVDSQSVSGVWGRRWGDLILAVLARGSALSVIGMLVVLLGVLAVAAVPSIVRFGPGFLVAQEWRPNEIERPMKGPDGKIVIEDGETVMEKISPKFGALPVIYGTAVSSVMALVFAVPLSLGTALFIVRVAPRLRLAGVVSFLVEFLASIPSIAYGIWGLFVLAPFLRNYVEPGLVDVLRRVPVLDALTRQRLSNGNVMEVSLTGRDMLCGGLILGIMILPVITAMSRDVLKTVPRGQVEGTMALGATWWQSCWSMLRYSRSGLFGAVMLGLARAAGETMAVAMVIGNNNQIEPSPFAPAQTMSSLLANEFAEAEKGLHQSALLQVALVLLVMSLLFNIVARKLVVGKGSTTAGAQ